MAKKKRPLSPKDINNYRAFKYLISVISEDYNGKMPMNLYLPYMKAIKNNYIKNEFENYFLPRLDKYEINIKKIKDAEEIKFINYVIDKAYGGKMTVNMYSSFLNLITKPTLKLYFINKFKSKLIKNKNTKTEKSPLTSSSSNKTLKTIEGNNYIVNNGIITVTPSEFSFHHTQEGPKLIYKNHKTFFMGKREWFDQRVLKSIDRIFHITLRNYNSSFVFQPLTDKNEFEKLLETKYLELKSQVDKEELEDCFSLVEEFLIIREKDFLNSFRQIKIKTYLNNYKFLKRKQIYEFKFNVFEYLQLPQTIRITIPLSSIIKHVQEEGYERFNNIVSEKWKKGYVKTFDITQVFPNLSKTETSIIIPKIFIDRFGKDKLIEIKVIYSEIEGKFNSKLVSYIRGYNYNTETSDVVFNQEIKTSLRNILRKINDRFIITFYTSYIKLFNEGYNLIQEIYEKELTKFNDDDNVWPYMSEYNRFVSGFSELQCFDKENNNDWMWLTEQLKKGEIKEAFVFRDTDQTYSSKVGDTVKYPVKVYLTISEDRYKRIIVSMYALDTEKSIYRFIVEKDRKYEAVFFVWSYFSSNNYNKRQDFLYIQHHFRDFGINYFYKDSPLEYRSGIGYCERGWLKE